ncbi:TauD/TfdA family dioxygenase [Micromonospora sp. RTGN7]|uniref:TauD/TfdA family dioxygenase n=1 Tax=Micromonospora sp. RTGN7 TaxID=3016526 RepID=UPI0029FF3E84|nr:TauD/TfdA family dioxygenase [Micromonospora sp. RTGN7]
MTDGTFLEGHSTHQYLTLREGLLGGRELPGPDVTALTAESQQFPEAAADALTAQLETHGLGLVQLDDSLSDDRFLALGRLLGTAMPETDPAVQPYVEQRVILNLRSEHNRTGDVALQPFATNYLSLHTEGSGRPPGDQPRYIVLLCHDPGDATSARTVLVPMRAVAAAMDPASLATLSQVRYRHDARLSPIVRYEDGRCVFTFRDFLAQPLEWTSHGDADADTVNDAIADLLRAMYSAESASSVHWRAGLLVVIDNRFFFHGRTAGPAVASPHRRHLRRLRVV